MSGTPPSTNPESEPSAGETPSPQAAPSVNNAGTSEGPVLAEKPALKIPDPIPIPEPLATIPSIPPPVTPPPEPVVSPAYTVPSYTPPAYSPPAPSGGGKPPGLVGRMRGEKEDDGGPRMSFIDHLMELRKRLWVSIITIVVSLCVALVFYDTLFAMLRYPLDNLNDQYRKAPDYLQILQRLKLAPGSDIVQLISTNPLGTMLMVMWIGIGAGLLLSSPIVIYEVWAFISPGLKEKEQNAIKPILYGGILFFLGGVALTYFLLFPVTMDFVVWLDVQEAIRIRPSYTVDEYFSLLLNMMWITGLICETPLVVGGLAKLGVVKPSHLTVYWRACVLASFVLGSIFSPGTDVMSMLVFSLLLLSLYIVSIFMAWLFYPKQKKEKSAE